MLGSERRYEEEGYQSVGIYGMYYMGENLLEELWGKHIEVKYAIDRNADRIAADVNLLRPEDDLSDVDAIVVTAFYFSNEIRANLQERINCPILSIGDLIYEMFYRNLNGEFWRKNLNECGKNF